MVIVSDTCARERAATATDCNIVVTAGAGTGKTTLLVDRLMDLVLRRPHPFAIGEIVALTFTNKAANEIKLRLRVELSKVGNHEAAIKALRDLEKSQIGTIHSFAAHLLRLYPVESGVDPSFQQDEGLRFKEYFNREWALWLDRELGAAGTRHDTWRAALRSASLEELKELAQGLTGETIPLDEMVSHHPACPGRAETRLFPMAILNSDHDVPPPIRQWVTTLAAQASLLRSAHPKTNTFERMLDAAIGLLESIAKSSIETEDSRVGVELGREVPGMTKPWEKSEYDQAKCIIRVAQSFTKVETESCSLLLQLLMPFAADCRRRFLQSGYISFDGLLARARTLLRDYPLIRRELKSQFRSILVDEFQDTDPVQYEMILYLAEAAGHEETDWRRVRLEPGKLFIVGDPKQSIYAFRRADMEAYDAVVDERILGQTPPGERHTLQTNFRSHHRLLAFLNGFFAGVFPRDPIKGLQPQHDPLLAFDTARPLSTEGVELRVVQPGEPDADADAASRAEAEELARWLSEEVLGREEIIEGGMPVKIKPRHVAMLFRKLTGLRDYLEALRRYDIPCLTEGEKHFYERQEIIDAVNLLRAAANPHDRLALVGVLRSSVGGVPDVTIEALARQHLLDYRIERSGASRSESRTLLQSVAPVYSLLRILHAELPRLPLTEVMDAMFAKAPLLEVAAASMDREQGPANLLKLRDLAADLAQRPDLTFHGLVAELTRRAVETPDEAESSLAEDVVDSSEPGAVRLLSIHKAKGLEFPVVILAGLHRATDPRTSRVLVQHDWSTGILGIRLGDVQTVGGIYVGAKLAERQRYEQHRVLYVAMTRAKRRLILSAGLPKKVPHDSFLSLIAKGLDLDPDSLQTEMNDTTIAVHDATARVKVLQDMNVSRRLMHHELATWRDADDDISTLQVRWNERDRRRQQVSRLAALTNPTALKAAMDEADPAVAESTGRTSAGAGSARLIGILAHRVLEGWDFSRPAEQLRDRVEAVCQHGIPMNSADGADQIAEELHHLFRSFSTSKPYVDLTRATILGREVPFAFPWIGEGHKARGKGSKGIQSLADSQMPRTSDPATDVCVMEGVIDLVYRLDGEVWVADYKTDRVEEQQLNQRAADYSLQARIYREAVARSLGITQLGFQFIFLRQGIAVPFIEEVK